MSIDSYPYRAPTSEGPAALPSTAGALGRPRRRLGVQRHARRLTAYPELLAVVVVAGVLNLWNLSVNGYANTFYAAAVKSMAGSWHNFVFAAMDRSGLMTIDKPPLAYWIQALVVSVFGYSSWSLLVPQAVMGVIAAVLMYDLTRRRFGRLAGFAAGLVLATTPTIVAVSRHNNPDELLVVLSVAAVWFALRALETGRTRHLVWAGVMIGLGFETKMGVALMLVPAIALAWVWMRWGHEGAGVRANLRVIRQLVWGGLAMAAVGLAWPLLVTLTPAADRPWISGTSDNSIWSLIVSYNGLGRLAGQTGGPAGGGGFGGNSMFGGSTGVFRLLQSALGDQAGWLLGFAAAAGLGLIVLTRLRRRDPRTGFVIVIGGTLLVVGVVFSFAGGIFHPYYVSMVAPWAAALIGAGVGEMLPRPVGVAQSVRTARILGPVAILAGAVTELVILGELNGQLGWAEPLVIAATIGGAVLLGLALSTRVRVVVVAAACAALLAAPAAWAAETLGYATSGTFPTGGPASAQSGGPGGAGGPGGRGGFGRSGSGRSFRGGFDAPGGRIRRRTSERGLPRRGLRARRVECRARRPIPGRRGRGWRLRRRQQQPGGGGQVRQDPWRRHGRRGQPEHGRPGDHGRRHQRRRDRRLLRPREHRQRRVAGDGGQAGPVALADRRQLRQSVTAWRHPHRVDRCDQHRREGREEGDLHLGRPEGDALRPEGQGGGDHGRRLSNAARRPPPAHERTLGDKPL